MKLKESPIPEFFLCGTKRFHPNELHVTRIYNKSVIIFVLEGTLRFREAGTVIELSKGEYYIQRAFLLQEGIPNFTPPVYFYIEFNGIYEDECDFGIPLRGTFSIDTMKPLFDNLEEAYSVQRFDPYTINANMLNIFGKILTPIIHFRPADSTVYAIRNYIESHYASELHLSDLSARFGYTESNIIRIFKRKNQVSPHQYLTNIRVGHAKWLLMNTDIPITQVSVLVGYSDFSTFYRNFCHVFGVSPIVCRENNKT